MIYSVPCKECGVRYKGETGQHFGQRVAQHQRDIRNKKALNGFYAHIKKNKGHTIDWDQAVFLDREKHRRGRKIKEVLFINAQNPTMEVNREKVMNFGKMFCSGPNLGRFQCRDWRNYVKENGKSVLRFYCRVFHF